MPISLLNRGDEAEVVVEPLGDAVHVVHQHLQAPQAIDDRRHGGQHVDPRNPVTSRPCGMAKKAMKGPCRSRWEPRSAWRSLRKWPSRKPVCNPEDRRIGVREPLLGREEVAGVVLERRNGLPHQEGPDRGHDEQDEDPRTPGQVAEDPVPSRTFDPRTPDGASRASGRDSSSLRTAS